MLSSVKVVIHYQLTQIVYLAGEVVVGFSQHVTVYLKHSEDKRKDVFIVTVQVQRYVVRASI